jgi:uncharacterized repeat protein (TIGR01451 family)
MEEQGNKSSVRGITAIAVAGLLAALALGLIGGAGASAAVGPTDLSLTKADTADPVTVGDTFGYVITVKNAGLNDAGAVTTTDTLPSQVSYVSATPSSGTCQKSGSKVTCDLGQINAGASATVTIMVKATSSGTASNTASLTSSDDTNATNNLDTETTVINKAPTTPKPPKKHKKSKPSCSTPTIVGTAGDDVLQGTSRADVIVSFTGNDQVFAGGGNDLVCADGGVDLVDGGPGKDFISGGGGPDKLIGSDGGDTLKGKNGRDKLLGGQGDDLLNGGKKRDKCKGGPGHNTLLNCP